MTPRTTSRAVIRSLPDAKAGVGNFGDLGTRNPGAGVRDRTLRRDSTPKSTPTHRSRRWHVRSPIAGHHQDLLAGDLGVPVGGALLGMRVDRAQQRIGMDEHPLVGAGQQIDPPANATRCSRSTESRWRACPKVNSRSNIPTVQGAYTPSNWSPFHRCAARRRHRCCPHRRTASHHGGQLGCRVDRPS